jgi:hypothetical protein
MAVPTNTY